MSKLLELELGPQRSKEAPAFPTKIFMLRSVLPPYPWLVLEWHLGRGWPGLSCWSSSSPHDSQAFCRCWPGCRHPVQCPQCHWSLGCRWPQGSSPWPGILDSLCWIKRFFSPDHTRQTILKYLRTNSVVALVPEVVELVVATLEPNRWLTVDDFPAPDSPRTRKQVWNALLNHGDNYFKCKFVVPFTYS